MRDQASDWFIGAGFSFPMQLDPAGSILLVRREREIEESIHLILGTAFGERPMRPEFGCGIHDYVFAEADAATAGLIAFEVREALQRWEPRVDVVNVEVTVDDAARNLLWIDVQYAIRGTNDPRNLVFPFYVIPEETP
jgi:phage baseplate assembly protein W